MLKKIVGGVIVAVSASALASAGLVAQSSPFKPDPSRPVITTAEYERWQKEISNWGRWGKDDEMGALNLITPAKRRAAAALVKEGMAVSLASNAATQKDLDVPCPAEWTMTAATQGAATDRIAYPCIHGAGATHLDSFAHIFFNGLAWNGYPVSTGRVEGKRRDPQLGAEHEERHRDARRSLRHPEAERGALSRARHPHLPRRPGSVGEEGRRQDWRGRRAAPPLGTVGAPREAGTVADRRRRGRIRQLRLPWLKQRDISLIAWETPGYVPQPPADLPRLALHNFALTMLGIMLIDRADLEAISEAAAARNRWEFMLSVAPLPIPYGTGSPVNPLALF